MAKQSGNGIIWTDDTWNPITGCTKVSAGCKNCYAERMWHRLNSKGQPYEGRTFNDVACHPERLKQPLRWRKPRRVFVNSMSDLFHPSVPDKFISAVFGVMAACPQHTFQVLTKRPARMVEWFDWFDWLERQAGQAVEMFPADDPGWRRGHVLMAAAMRQGVRVETSIPKHRLRWRGVSATAADIWPLPNVCLGVSIEDQATADERIPLLLKTPAAVRWVSAEPLLGAVNLADWLPMERALFPDHPGLGGQLDWVVVGGESGSKARPMHPDWVRSLRDQCVAAGVPFLFKQWGQKHLHRELDGQVWEQYPEVTGRSDE